MGRGITLGKKEKEKKKAKQRQDKAEKMEERRANAKKGQSLEDMMAYIDEDGNISATPPDPKKKRTFEIEEIQIGVPKQVEGEEEDPMRLGKVSYFNESKGFGFIIDSLSNERVFVHIKELEERIQENDKVSFEIEQGPKGLNAVRVKKV